MDPDELLAPLAEWLLRSFPKGLSCPCCRKKRWQDPLLGASLDILDDGRKGTRWEIRRICAWCSHVVSFDAKSAIGFDPPAP